MITAKDIYEVLSALIPLYAAMSLAYASVRWWKIFTPEQCAGVNRFVAVFAIPLLSFKLIAFSNPYTMNLKLIIADTLQKIVVLATLFLWTTLFRRNKSSLDWIITLKSLSTLPNTLVMGIPLLRAMYGEFSTALMVQVVVFQGVIWYTLLLIMFEYRAAKLFISENFPQTGGSIASFEAESDVISLATGGEDHDHQALHAEVAAIDGSGRLHVVVKRNSSDKFPELGYATSATPRVSNLTGVEICSMRTSAETPRISSFNQAAADFANFKSRSTSTVSLDKDQLHMFVWNSTANSSPVSVSQRNELRHAFSYKGFSSAPTDLHDHVTTKKDSASSNDDNESKEGIGFSEKDGEDKQQMPPASVMTKLILTMVWRKLIRNPNTYASFTGILWSVTSFRWNITMPLLVKGCIKILSDTGLGMSMFSLGLFMAIQPKIIACGKCMAMLSLAVRFLVGPAVMTATSFAIGIRGVLLQVSIVQAALPQAIVSFVFAKEYNVHPQILSTSVTIGMVVALPVTVLYYVLLGL